MSDRYQMSGLLSWGALTVGYQECALTFTGLSLLFCCCRFPQTSSTFIDANSMIPVNSP